MSQVPKPQKFFYGYVIVAACFVMMVVFWGTFNSFGVFLESLLKELGGSRAVTSGAFAVNGFTFGVFSIPIVKLADRYGVRLVLGLCGVVLGLGYFLLSMVSSMWQLYVYYAIVLAIGMSAYIAILPIVARWFVKRRATMTGVVFSGMGVGIMAVPRLISRVIEINGWQFAYIIVGIIALVGITGAAVFLRRDPRQMGLLPYGVSQEDSGHTGGLSFREALGTHQFWVVCGLYFIYLICYMVITAHIVIHATDMSIPPVMASNIFIAIGLLMILGMNVSGVVADRTSNKLAYIGSFAVMVVAFIWLLWARNLGMLYVFGVVVGFAWGGMQILYSPITAELFGLKAHGVILAMAALFGSIGAAAGPVMGGAIYDALRSYQLAFIICLILSVIGLVAAIALTPLKKKS